MLNKLLTILLLLFSTFIIYSSNSNLIIVSVFTLLILYIVNRNFYSFILIIPLILINPITFVLFLFSYVFLYITNILIKNKITHSLIIFFYSTFFILLLFFNNNIDIISLISTLGIISVAITLSVVNKFLYKKTVNHILLLIVFIFNLKIISPVILLVYFTFFTLTESIINKNSYYIFTGFILSLYGYLQTEDFLFLTIEIIAYLGYLFLFIRKKNNKESLTEYILDDINLNVGNFCSFISNFKTTLTANDYDKRLSISIKILIERYCSLCIKRTTCFANKKVETYNYIKDILTKKKQINSTNERKDLFECNYYYKMTEDAVKLQKEYSLEEYEKDNYNLLELSSSIQNYMIYLMEKNSLEITKLIRFKKELIDKNIVFYDFKYSIIDKNNFSFKIYANKREHLKNIYDYAKTYFKGSRYDIFVCDSFIGISMKKEFKVIYDHAVLSVNNLGISGDNILIKTINETNFLCALSDGMGSGYNAYKLSEETLRLLDKITDCDITFNVSLEILNNFFKIKDHYEKFATLDLVQIDLTNGLLNLYKLGSSTTYISRGNTTIPIYNNNLPFGISDLITKAEYSLEDNDLIVLVSDGINDYIPEHLLSEFINTIKHESPHKIVYEILQKIYHLNNNFAQDDMSCIAIKIKNA